MATIWIEGFDNYGATGIALPSLGSVSLAEGGWTVLGGVASIVPSLNGQTGYAVSITRQGTAIGAAMIKGLQQSYARLIGGLRILAPTSLAEPSGFQLLDNTTTQVSVAISAVSGTIAIYRGGWNSGTLLQVSNESVAGNTEHYIEFDITFGVGGAGGWTVWLDGVEILGGTGTTVVSANNSVDGFQIGDMANVTAPIHTVDDIYLFDGTTTVNNAVVLSNPVVLTDSPLSDTSVQFTNIGNVVGNTSSTNAVAMSLAANSLWLMPITPAVACTLDGVAVQLIVGSGNDPTAHFEGVIYADNAGAPGALLSGGSVLTGFTNGQLLNLSLSTPQALTAATQYWIGFINDTGTSIYASSAVGVPYRYAANTFTSGPPATAPAMTNGAYPAFMYGLCTGSVQNWNSEAVVPPVGDSSAVSSATVGDTDLYKFPALPTNIQAVYTVSVSGNAHLTQSGTHKIDMVAYSGTSTSTGNNPNIAPTVTYAWYDSPVDTDPATGLAWTLAGVNGASFGMKVAT